jgi:hypothetical protein
MLGTVKNMRKIKFRKFLGNLLLLLVVLIIILIIGEIFCRIVFGNVLIKEYKSDGWFYLLPNQSGWYPPSITDRARINNLGARGNDVNLSWIENNNKYVFFGDSFTFGWLLKDDQTMPHYFQKFMNLSDNQVINFGQGGYGIDHMIENYKFNSGLFKSGDVFFVVIIDQDFIRPITPLNMGPIKGFLWDIKRHSSFLSFLYESTGVLQYNIKSDLGIQPKLSGEYFNETSFGKIIDFNSLLKSKNQTLVLIFYEYNQTNFSKEGINLCSNNKLNCVTNVPQYISTLNKNETLFASDGGHPSQYSNYVVANDVANFIKQNNLSIS